MNDDTQTKQIYGFRKEWNKRRTEIFSENCVNIFKPSSEWLCHITSQMCHDWRIEKLILVCSKKKTFFLSIKSEEFVELLAVKLIQY